MITRPKIKTKWYSPRSLAIALYRLRKKKKSGFPPDYLNLLAWYKRDIQDGRLIPYRPLGSATPQVKGSLFSVAVPEDVPYTGLLTTDVITVGGGTVPTCAVNGTLSMSANFWDMRVHRAGVLWAYLPGINIGGAFELDASGNGHHLYLTTTTIVEVLDGTGTNYCNSAGYRVAENILYAQDVGNADVEVTGPDVDGFYSAVKVTTTAAKAVTASLVNQSGTLTTPTAEVSVRLTLRALDGNESTTISLAHNLTSGHVVRKISGPGEITGTYRASVTGLSLTDDTIVEVTKTNNVIGADWSFLIYAGSVTTTRIGDGVRFKNIQICLGTTTANYTSRKRTPLGRYPVSSFSSAPFENISLIGDSMVNAASEQMQLLFTGSTILQKGVGGQTSTQVAARFVADTVGSGADAAILFVGHNDINGAVTAAVIEANIQSCAEAARAANMPLILCTISPYGTYSGWAAGEQTELESVNTWMRAYAATNGHVLVDMYEMMRDPGTINLRPLYASLGDGLHYNGLGDDYEGQLFAAAIVSISGGTTARTIDVLGNTDAVLGPLNASAEVTAGDTYPAVTVKAPLGPEFQAITEWTGEAAVDLSTFVNTDQTVAGEKDLLIYKTPLSMANKIRAERFAGA